MRLEAFNHTQLECYDFSPSGDDEYAHTLGGSAFDHGYSFPELPCALHLIARLDTSDVRLGLSNYSTRWVPLFYGIHLASECSDFVYQVSDSGEVLLVDRPLIGRMVYDPNFPYQGHPPSFSEIQLRCTKTDFDPCKPKDAVEYQGVFDLKNLPKESLPEAIKIGLYNPGTISWLRSELHDPDWDDETILRCLGTAPFFQNSPSRCCANHRCAGWKPELQGDKSVEAIAILHSGPKDGFWDGASIQFVFSLCRICHSIHSEYQCT